MIRSGHFAANRIETSCAELQERLGQLRDLASVRRLRLLDAVESQMVIITYSFSWLNWVFKCLTCSGRRNLGVRFISMKIVIQLVLGATYLTFSINCFLAFVAQIQGYI